MLAVNDNDLVTFYTKREYQVFRQRSVDGEPATVLYADFEFLLPFQIQSDTDLSSVVSFKLYDQDGDEIADLDTGLIDKVSTSDGGYFYTYKADTSIGIQLDCGQLFYIVVRFLPVTYYSDLMEAIEITNPDILGGSGTID